jgi:hypothetical protein
MNVMQNFKFNNSHQEVADQPVKKRKPRTRTGRKRMTDARRETALLKFFRDNEGRAFLYHDIANGIGLLSGTSINASMKNLLDRGRIIREHHGFKRYSYKVQPYATKKPQQQVIPGSGQPTPEVEAPQRPTVMTIPWGDFYDQLPPEKRNILRNKFVDVMLVEAKNYVWEQSISDTPPTRDELSGINKFVEYFSKKMSV